MTRNKQKRVQMEAALESFRHDENVNIILLDRRNAEGLALSFVTHIFILEPLSDLSLEEQVISRAYRMGQQHKAEVFVLAMKDTIEQQLLELQSQEQVLSASAAKEAIAQKSVLTHLHLVDVPGEDASAPESTAAPASIAQSGYNAASAAEDHGTGLPMEGVYQRDDSAAVEAHPRPNAPDTLNDYIASLQYHQDLEQRRVEHDVEDAPSAAQGMNGQPHVNGDAPRPDVPASKQGRPGILQKRVRFALPDEQPTSSKLAEGTSQGTVKPVRTVRFAEDGVDSGRVAHEETTLLPEIIDNACYIEEARQYLRWLKSKALVNIHRLQAAPAEEGAAASTSTPREFGLSVRAAIFDTANSPSPLGNPGLVGQEGGPTAGAVESSMCQIMARISIKGNGSAAVPLALRLENGLYTTVEQLASHICAQVGAVPSQLKRLWCMYPPRPLLVYKSSPLGQVGVQNRYEARPLRRIAVAMPRAFALCGCNASGYDGPQGSNPR